LFCNILGLLAFVISGFHIFSKFVKDSHETALQDSSMREIEYMLPQRVNWLLLIVMAPMVFVAMTMHASSSLWTILTGSGGTQPLTEVQELALYDQSLAFAELFQFTSVYAFARICQSFLSQRLEEASAPPRGEKAESLQTIAKQYRTLIRLAGFLGVWAYIVVGVVQCTITVVFTGLQLSEISTSNELRDTLFTNLDNVYAFLTIVAVLNMLIICRSEAIQSRLGWSANLKFQGARLLLLVSVIEEEVLDAFTKGDPLHEKLADRLRLPSFTEHQAHLLHLSLLSIWCLIAAVLNHLSWWYFDIKDGVCDFNKVEDDVRLPCRGRHYMERDAEEHGADTTDPRTLAFPSPCPRQLEARPLLRGGALPRTPEVPWASGLRPPGDLAARPPGWGPRVMVF